MIATDRMQAARIATGGKDAHVVPRVYGRVGYDVPVAQSATFRLKQYDRTPALRGGPFSWRTGRCVIPEKKIIL